MLRLLRSDRLRRGHRGDWRLLRLCWCCRGLYQRLVWLRGLPLLRRQRIHCAWHPAGCQLLLFGSLNGCIDSSRGALHRVRRNRNRRAIAHSLTRLGYPLGPRGLRARLAGCIRGCGAGAVLGRPLGAAGAILFPDKVCERDGLRVLFLKLYLAVFEFLPLFGGERLVLLERLIDRLGRAAGALHQEQRPGVLLLDLFKPLRLVRHVRRGLELHVI